MTILAVLAVAVAVGAIVQGSIGFGYALLAVPTMALLVPWAVPVTPLLLALPMTVLMSARGWRSIDMGGFFLITSGRLVGTAAGIALLILAPKGWLSALTGLLIVAAALGSFLKPAFEVTNGTRIVGGWPLGWWAPSRPSVVRLWRSSTRTARGQSCDLHWPSRSWWAS